MGSLLDLEDPEACPEGLTKRVRTLFVLLSRHTSRLPCRDHEYKENVSYDDVSLD